MKICLAPIAYVRNTRTEAIDDNWLNITSEIELAGHIPADCLLNISAFSHLEIIYFFDKVADEEIIYSGRPRGNPDYPVTGIFAQRKKDRPNRLGLSIVELIQVHERALTVKRLDAIDGTPVLDIKPVFTGFLPAGPVVQPDWARDLMKDYW